jgi:hypothetical protein
LAYFSGTIPAIFSGRPGLSSNRREPPAGAFRQAAEIADGCRLKHKKGRNQNGCGLGNQ